MAHPGREDIGSGSFSGSYTPMSEYQYYEFRAIERALTDRQMQELRAISTRAAITRTSFSNYYTFGDLKADPGFVGRPALRAKLPVPPLVVRIDPGAEIHSTADLGRAGKPRADDEREPGTAPRPQPAGYRPSGHCPRAPG